jgi:antitoxin component YwqK of YwqJK toxin-antitoxin module
MSSIQKTYWECGNLKTVRYTKEGFILHREDGPAEIWRYQSGSVEYEMWCKEGECHRDDGPAWIAYWVDGSVKSEIWYKNGDRHREDGPSLIWYKDKGNADDIQYWLENKRLDFWDFYDQSSEENQKIILRVWLPYCHG